MAIMLTGGAGFIGSHTAVQLLAAGREVVIVDNLDNSKPEAVARCEEIAQRRIPFHIVDLRHRDALNNVFQAYSIEAVIHFAGRKAVGESVEQPMLYYQHNIIGTLTLCEVMAARSVKNLVFSSSCTVYGEPDRMPVTEDFPVGEVTNPYARTKLMIEQILHDLQRADNSWNIALLRYFNPVGAHPSGRIGEDPQGIPNNLMPFVTQVAIGKRPHLNVFGNDYPTPDGTGIRDYIHVVDLADGHVAGLQQLEARASRGDNRVNVWNLGTGRGYSVLEVVSAFEKASKRPVPYKITPRRAGDIPRIYADPARAERELGWKARRSLEEMCADAWRWQNNNPDGYSQ